MKEIDLYTDYGFEDDDKYVLLSVDANEEIAFKLSAPNAFMYMLLSHPSLDGNGFKGITKIWQEDLLLEAENDIIEVDNLEEAKDDIVYYIKNANTEETNALYLGIIDIIDYSINHGNKLYISIE